MTDRAVQQPVPSEISLRLAGAESVFQVERLIRGSPMGGVTVLHGPVWTAEW